MIKSPPASTSTPEGPPTYDQLGHALDELMLAIYMEGLNTFSARIRRAWANASPRLDGWHASDPCDFRPSPQPEPPPRKPAPSDESA